MCMLWVMILIIEIFRCLLIEPSSFSFVFASFEFRLRVSLALDGNLNMISRIRNIDGKPFSFSFAYHTYLSVSDIRYALIFMLV